MVLKNLFCIGCFFLNSQLLAQSVLPLYEQDKTGLRPLEGSSPSFTKDGNYLLLSRADGFLLFERINDSTFTHYRLLEELNDQIHKTSPFLDYQNQFLYFDRAPEMKMHYDAKGNFLPIHGHDLARVPWSLAKCGEIQPFDSINTLLGEEGISVDTLGNLYFLQRNYQVTDVYRIAPKQAERKRMPFPVNDGPETEPDESYLFLNNRTKAYPLNDPFYDEVPRSARIFPDGQKLIFTKDDPKRRSYFFMAHQIGGEWQLPFPLAELNEVPGEATSAYFCATTDELVFGKWESQSNRLYLLKNASAHFPSPEVFTLYFEEASAELAASETAKLEQIAEALWVFKGAVLGIEGFASVPGSHENNFTLSRQRAEAVKLFLEKKGFPKAAFRIVASGELKATSGNVEKDQKVVIRLALP